MSLALINIHQWENFTGLLLSVTLTPLAENPCVGHNLPSRHSNPAEMESVCRDMDPRNHMDMVAGPPLQDPECWEAAERIERHVEAVLSDEDTEGQRDGAVDGQGKSVKDTQMGTSSGSSLSLERLASTSSP